VPFFEVFTFELGLGDGDNPGTREWSEDAPPFDPITKGKSPWCRPLSSKFRWCKGKSKFGFDTTPTEPM